VSPTVSIFTSVHPPDDPRIREKSLGTLLARGWQVTYVCQAPGPTTSNGITVRRLSGGRVARSAKAIWNILTSKSDVVVVHDPELLVGAIPAGWIRGKNRVVFDVHENIPGQMRTRSSTPKLLRRPTAWLAKAVLRVAESAVTLTLAEPAYRSLFRHDQPVFENLPVAGALPIRSDHARGIVYVGDITSARGAMVLVDAVGMLGIDQPLTLIGRCESRLREELEAAAQEHGVELVMPGYLSYTQAWRLAAQSLIGVSPLNDLPNYRNSLPTKIVEYRSVGLVSVVSDLPASLHAIGGSTAARSFVAGDPADLARVLSEVLSKPDAGLAALGEVGDVRATHLWPADRFDDFYRSLLVGGNA
jgi:glycosyltransferase involved in cell wall biosynthesis